MGNTLEMDLSCVGCTKWFPMTTKVKPRHDSDILNPLIEEYMSLLVWSCTLHRFHLEIIGFGTF